jgi:hypothetical protein
VPLVDEPNTDYEDKAWANMTTIRLYDPAVDGKTPADGAGLPATSEIVLRDKDAKLADGFTTTVVGWDEEYTEIGNAPVRPGSPYAPTPVDGETPTGTVMSKQARTRTIKR